MKRPAWLNQFLSWASEPCPQDAWIYRGQAAEHPSVLPGYLRPAHRKFFADRLHSLDTSLVRLLMERSSRLTPTRLFGGSLPIQPQPLGPSPTATIGGATGPFDFAPTQAEVTAALAQHYGLPTIYIDVSFDPVVAAFFATHEQVDGTFRPSSEPGRIIRWPARRRTEFLLEIDDPGRPNPAESWADAMFTGELEEEFKKALEEAGRDGDARPLPGLRVIDLTSMDKAVRRPHAQRGALACPVYFDGNPFASEWLPGPASSVLPTPLHELGFTDMSLLPNAEAHTLSSSAGEEFEEATGLSASAIYPDRIDLGYSFFGIAALLSIVSWGSPDDLAAVSQAISSNEFRAHEILQQRLERGLDAAHTVIGRESFRLLVGFSAETLRATPPLSAAGDELRRQAATAIEGCRSINLPEARERRRREVMLAAQELQRARRVAASKFCRDFAAKTGVDLELSADAFPVPSISEESLEFDVSWVPDEIRRRLAVVDRILADANCLPAYAVLDPTLLPFDPALFPLPDDYEKIVRQQASALAGWLKDDAFVSGA